MSAEQSRVRRGLVLMALNAQYPLGLAEAALELQVGPFYAGDQRALVRDLAYLEDSGYLARKSVKVARQSVRSFEITPKGIDVVECSVTDPGVVISDG